MKKIIVLSLALLSLAVSCKKSPAGEDSREKGMTFTAAASQGLKSHFAEGTDNLNLLWDEYDNLAVYSFNTEDADPAASVVGGIAYIQPEGIGQSTAQFRSSKLESEWFVNPQTDGKKRFVSYYPAYGLPTDLVEEKGEKVLPLHISYNQAGKNDYGKHHIMLSRGNEYAQGESVLLQNFTPLTSLLKFRLKMEGGYDYRITSIELESYFYGKVWENDSEDRYNSSYHIVDPVSGVDKWFYPDNLVEGRYVKVSELLSGEEIKVRSFVPRESSSSSNGRYMRLLSDDEESYTLTATEGEDLYAVVFPTDTYPSRGELALRIRAYYEIRRNGEYLHQVSHEGFIRIPYPGYVAGKRYDFVMTLTPSAMYLQDDPDSPAWGYDIVDWND